MHLATNMVSVTVIFNLLLIACVLEANAFWRKGTFWHDHGLPLEELNNLTLAKFNGSSDIGCARRCTRYPGCTSFSLAPGLCTLMTARHNVKREPGGVDFYIVRSIEPNCVEEGGTLDGTPFNFSSAYYASYHQITKIRLYYDRNERYLQGLEVHHGNAMAQIGLETSHVHECLLQNNEFIQKWYYSTLSMWSTPVLQCISLETTHKTCGPYGNSCFYMVNLRGNDLLYISGHFHENGAFERLSLAFDSC